MYVKETSFCIFIQWYKHMLQAKLEDMQFLDLIKQNLEHCITN